jgi:hypothetical protein
MLLHRTFLQIFAVMFLLFPPHFASSVLDSTADLSEELFPLATPTIHVSPTIPVVHRLHPTVNLSFANRGGGAPKHYTTNSFKILLGDLKFSPFHSFSSHFNFSQKSCRRLCCLAFHTSMRICLLSILLKAETSLRIDVVVNALVLRNNMNSFKLFQKQHETFRTTLSPSFFSKTT